MTLVDLSLALLMGLTGSLHCAGMCGPIVWVMPFQSFAGMKRWIAVLVYHFSRISVYALLGFILFSFRSLFHPEIQQYISIGLGTLLLLAGFLSFFPTFATSMRLPWSGFVTRHLGRFIGNPGLGTLALSGFLNGMLPCGLVYMALSLAVAAPAATDALLMMYVFGLGTMPVLILLTVLKGRISFLRGTGLRKAVPVVMLVFGSLFVLRGLNLGIPYVSPEVTVTQEEVKAACCHK